MDGIRFDVVKVADVYSESLCGLGVETELNGLSVKSTSEPEDGHQQVEIIDIKS